MEIVSNTIDNKGKGFKRLTIAELKKCKGFENYSDEEAEKTIETLVTLSILFFELHAKHQQTEKHLKLIKQSKKYEEHRTAA